MDHRSLAARLLKVGRALLWSDSGSELALEQFDIQAAIARELRYEAGVLFAQAMRSWSACKDDAIQHARWRCLIAVLLEIIEADAGAGAE